MRRSRLAGARSMGSGRRIPSARAPPATPEWRRNSRRLVMRHRQAGDDAKLLRGRAGGKRGTDSLQKPEHPRRSEPNLRRDPGVHASVSYLLERDTMSRSDGELLPGTFDMLVL